MNTIELSLSGNKPNLVTKIDNVDIFSMDEFKDGFIPVSVPTFLFNEYLWSESDSYDVYNGTLLIGTCSCGCDGCDDIIVKISTNTRTTKWIIMQDLNHKKKKKFTFNAKEYHLQIENLKENYYSYSWETNADRIRRLCTEYIRMFTTKEGYNIEGVKINPEWDFDEDIIVKDLTDTIEIYYYSDWKPMGEGIGRPYQNWKIKFDGKTLESAMKSLEKFSIKNLIKNTGTVTPRPYPFRLLYTKDTEQIKKIIDNSIPKQITDVAKAGEKPLSWTDIEISLKNSLSNSPGETDEEKLAYFKKGILDHLNILQAEEDKKIIPFPRKKQEKE